MKINFQLNISTCSMRIPNTIRKYYAYVYKYLYLNLYYIFKIILYVIYN